MSTSVIERTREFGVMKAIGASGGAIRRLVLLEGGFIAALSCAAAAVPAVALTWAMGASLGGMFFGTPIPFEISAGGIAVWIFLIACGAALASLAPASQAARLTVREAIAYL
jgi:putative ABC transport system permease protein